MSVAPQRPVISLLAALQDPRPVIDALVTEVTASDPSRRERVLGLLWEIEPAAVPQPALLLEVLEENVTAHPVDYWAAACLERWINRTDQAPELLPRLEALALDAVRTGGGTELTPLAHAVGGLPEFSAPREMRARLLAAMLASPGAPAYRLPEILGQRLPEDMWAVDQLVDAAEGAGKDMEHALFRAALEAPFARQLAQRRFAAETDALRRFFGKLDQGVPPEDAANAVMRDLLGG
jgi:hypothetical protein